MPLHKSFISRAFLIERVGFPFEGSDYIKDVELIEPDFEIDLSLFAANDDFKLTGGLIDQVRFPDEARRMSFLADTKLLVSWKDAELTAVRDALLLFIGAMLGLAAASGLEWMRPYVGSTDLPSDGLKEPGKPQRVQWKELHRISVRQQLSRMSRNIEDIWTWCRSSEGYCTLWAIATIAAFIYMAFSIQPRLTPQLTPTTTMKQDCKGTAPHAG